MVGVLAHISLLKFNVLNYNFKLRYRENITKNGVLSGGFRGGRAGRAPTLKFAKHMLYNVNFKQFNKKLFHEWLTRDL